MVGCIDRVLIERQDEGERGRKRDTIRYKALEGR
jgi:hypothetical protein